MKTRKLNLWLLLLCVGLCAITRFIAKDVDWAFISATWVLYLILHGEK